jgi:lipopolysaccharide transport protein LptA
VGLLFPLHLAADIIEDLNEVGKEESKEPVQEEKPAVGPTASPVPSKKEGEKGKKSPPSDSKATESGAVPAAGKDKKAKNGQSSNTTSRPTSSNNGKEPIHFKSDGKSSYTKAGDIVYLEKNVLITQGNLTFKADTAKVHLQKGSSEKGNVDWAEFSGAVKISQSSSDPAQDMTANATKAFFHNDKRRVDLIGNAKLWRGGHLIKGKQISYFLDTGMITVDEAQGVVKPKNENDETKSD